MGAETYPQEILADEEPKYLRRQKPVEIKRRKFGRKAWITYLRIGVWSVFGLAVISLGVILARFLLYSPETSLIHPDQVEIVGGANVTPASVLEVFRPDRGRSVLRVPLEQRRKEIETIPWVEKAVVRRALPDRIEVVVTERTPIAFLRQGSDLALVDEHGVILERPQKGNFHFPVVSGIDSSMAADEREKRMQLFEGFTREVESVHAGASGAISEVDVADLHDLRATISGLQNKGGSADASGSVDAPVLVHFGDADFGSKYQSLEENIAQWRATTGRVQSVDLRFGDEAVVNPDTSGQTKVHAAPKATHATVKHVAKHSH